MFLDAPGSLATGAAITGRAGGVSNWNIELPQAGSRNFTINRFNASTGAYLGTAMSIDHSSGVASFGSNVIANITGNAGSASTVAWTGVSGRPSVTASSGGGAARWIEVQGGIVQVTQVGVTVTGGDTAVTVNFPRSFPNACVNVQCTLQNGNAGYALFKVNWVSATQCSITYTDIKTSHSTSSVINVMAFGY